MVGNGGRQQRPWSNKPFYPARLWSTARLERGRSGRVTALPGSQLVVLSAACGVDCWVSACSWLPAWYRVRFRYALLAYAPRRVWLMACGYVGAQL